jgi:hypothetical protein
MVTVTESAKRSPVAKRQQTRATLASVAQRGDYAATLRALRNRLAREIDACEQPRDVAPLAARMTDVLAQLEGIKAPTTSKRDELAKKRAARQRAAASGRPDAADTSRADGADNRGN